VIVPDGEVSFFVGDKGGPYRDQLYDSRPRRTIQVASALSEAELLVQHAVVARSEIASRG
jgi:hypothetical protein